MIFTARQAGSGRVSTTPFIARGLNLAPEKITDLGIFAKPTKTQIAYGDYEKNISAFCFATATKLPVLLGLCNYPLELRLSSCCLPALYNVVPRMSLLFYMNSSVL